MPVTIQLDMPPVGYVVEPGFGGEMVTVCAKAFNSSEDGNDFISRLDGVSGCYKAAFDAAGVRPAGVETFLAVVTPKNEATVYLNELRLHGYARVNRASPAGMKAGELLYVDDISDIEQLDVRDAEDRSIEIPPDCGFSLILSHGWRKGLYFDYSVFGPHAKPRTDNLPRLFGHFLTRLTFQEMYSITESQWGRLLDWGWFPFMGLKHEDRKGLLAWANYDRHPGPVLEGMCRTFTATLGDRVESWKGNEYLSRDMAFITHAKERFEAGDYLSCISILYPRIEGLMRRLFADENPADRVSQGAMVSNLVENQFAHSVLLPNRFEQFLKRVYFREFDVASGRCPLSRHSIAHGVSDPADYDLTQAAVGFLTLDQLVRYLTD